MHKLESYRKIIKEVLTRYHQLSNADTQPNIEDLLAFDEKQDNYFWFRSGWDGNKRVSTIIIFLRLKNDKIWVEEDWTDLCVVDYLLEAGVPKTDIVLASHPPSKRKFTKFAIA